MPGPKVNNVWAARRRVHVTGLTQRYQMGNDHCTLVMGSEGPPGAVDLCEVADFLFLFRGVYAQCALSAGESADIGPAALATRVRKALSSSDLMHTNSLFRSEERGCQIWIRTVKRSSPLEISMEAVGYFLSAAVIVSGGEIEITPNGIRASLPPISQTIRGLREAFSPNPEDRLGFGQSRKTVALNKMEFPELFADVPPRRGLGGFQNLLLDLQAAVVDKRSRKIILSEDLVLRIKRQGRFPKRGGYQKRIRTIFARQINFGD